jgi:hypothetical protein
VRETSSALSLKLWFHSYFGGDLKGTPMNLLVKHICMDWAMVTKELVAAIGPIHII